MATRTLGRISEFLPKTSLSHDVKAASLRVCRDDHVLSCVCGVQAAHEVQASRRANALHRDRPLDQLGRILCASPATGGSQPNVSSSSPAGCIGPIDSSFLLYRAIVGAIAAELSISLLSGTVTYKYVSHASLFRFVCPTHHNKQIVLTWISPVPAENINLSRRIY